MTEKLKIPLRIVKWFAFALVILTFSASQMSKLFQVMHLKSIGFNVVSYSPISVLLGLFTSMALIILVLIDRAVYKHRLVSPLQIVALLGGIFGLLYNLFLVVLLFGGLI